MAEPKRREVDQWGPGVMADGSVDVFPASDLARRVAERDAMLADDDDDLSDLGEVEKAFGSKKKAGAADAD